MKVWVPSAAVYILWMRRHVVHDRGALAWPMYLGTVPAPAVVSAVGRMVGRDTRRMVLDCMRVVCRVQAGKMVLGGVPSTWWAPQCAALATLPGFGPKDHCDPPQPHAEVPAEVLHWAGSVAVWAVAKQWEGHGGRAEAV